jgi:hypothetical protein
LVDVDSGHALHQVFGCNTAHAYLLSASAIDHILRLLPSPPEIWPWLARHRAIDRFYYHNLSPKLTITALSPSLIVQRPCFSDIVGKNVASCVENHQTIIEPNHLDSQAFESRMHAQAVAFRRAAFLDQLRALWKKLRGF